ncbi:MAG: BamA/TamA family outer membrane protein [Sandaracinaceae bacterium]
MGVLLFTLVFMIGLPCSTEAQVRDPDLTWRTIDSPHFTIHYHIPLGVLARRVLAVAERANGVVSDVMGYEAGRRTHIVLTDNTDSANGSAIALPFNQIRLFASAPSAMSPLGDYDDWLNLLTTHEHTHIVHLDQWSGISSFINVLLGKVYAPNHVQPRWILEGVATWQESQRTSGGRLRSTMFDMYLRMDALEDRFFEIDQMTHIADRWPHGNVWYLYGSQFIQYVADRYGREAIARFAREYGDSTLPFAINSVASEATGGPNWVELYDDFLSERRTHYEAQRDAVIAGGQVEGERITFHGEVARTPRFDREGRVLYWRSDARQRNRIQRFALDNPEAQETLARVRGQAGYDIHPSGRMLYYTRVDNHRDIYSFHDIFRQDLESGQVERLTHGMRAREPDISSDGRRVVFTTNEAGTTQLRIADVRDIEGTARSLVENARFEQVFNPRFSPDGRTVAFSRWQHGGYRDIQLVDVESGRVDAITHDRAQDQTVAWAPDGRSLYFSSDRTGIANIYRYVLRSGRLEQVTNVVSGAYQPALSADGEQMVYVGYTSYGFDLFHLDLSEVSSRPAPSYIDRRPPALDDDDLFNGPSRDYQPLETLWPRSYLLDLANDGFGAALGLTVSGEDLAGFHRWSARVTHGFIRANTNVDLGYSYNRQPLGIGASFFRRISPRGGYRVGGEEVTWIEEAVGGELRLNYRLPLSFRSQTVSASYRAFHLSNAEPFGGRLDPNTPPPDYPELGFRSSLRLAWRYSDVERYLYDISPSDGRSLGFNLQVSDPLIGSDVQTVQLTWFLRQYFRMPWLQHHVLAVSYAGGLAATNQSRRSAFTVGGWPEVSPLDALLSNAILGGNALRGYPAFDRGGDQYHLVQFEYRFPIWRINHGVLTLPVYLNRLHAAVFFDAGDAFFGQLDIERFRAGVGGQLMLDFTIGYALPFTLRVGYARGLMDGGIDSFYAHMGVPF